MNQQSKFYESMSTPWGRIQTYTVIAEGVVSVTTAGHGGIWLSDERIKQLPAHYEPFTGTRRWAEEDEDGALVLQYLGLLSLITEPMTLEVTEADITKGRESRKALYNKPIFPKCDDKGLYGGPIVEAYQRQTGTNGEMICSYHLSPRPGGFKLARLCDAARDFLQRFDAGETVAPTTFVIEPYIVYERVTYLQHMEDGKVHTDRVSGHTAKRIADGDAEALATFIEHQKFYRGFKNCVKITREDDGSVIYQRD